MSRISTESLWRGTKTALPNPNLDLYRQLHSKGIPVIFINGSYAAPARLHLGAGRQLRRRISACGVPDRPGAQPHCLSIFKSDDIQGIERYSGYVHALRDHGKLGDNTIPAAWFTTENRARVMDRQLVEDIRSCTATVCYNDEVAYILISLLEESGVRVPQDMAVVSFDNSYFSELGSIKITSLSHEDLNTGALAATKLLKKIAGEPIASEVVP